MSKKNLLIAVVCLPLLALQGFSASFMKIESEKADQYKGGSKTKGHEGWIELISFHVVEPAGMGKGTAAASKGKREHATVTVLKKAGELSPELKAALDGKAKLSKVTIEEEVGAKSGLGKGTEDKPISVVLTNAMITKFSMAADSKGGKAKEKTGERETIEFSYQKIEWTRSSGKQFSDSWTASN